MAFSGNFGSWNGLNSGARLRAPAASALAGLYPHVVARVALPQRLALLDRLTEALESGETPVSYR